MTPSRTRPDDGAASAGGDADSPGSASGAALATHLDALRLAAGKTEALAATAVESYDNAEWSGADRALVERMAYVIEAVAEAARATVVVVEQFHGFVADRQRSGDGEWW